MDSFKHKILERMPLPYRSLLRNLDFFHMEEIRFRLGRPVMLQCKGATFFLSIRGSMTRSAHEAKIAEKAELSLLAEFFCNNSVYAILQDLKDGFITLPGGHRVGFAGKCVLKNGQVTNLTALSGINVRIAHEYKGCARSLLPIIYKKNCLKNTLLIAPPGCGKTTMLRDLAQGLSEIFKITVVDERSEIAGSYEGMPQFDMGLQTDVLDRFPKTIGMLLALRSLSPQLLITDEVGTPEEISAICHVQNAGCKLITSVHGYDLDSVQKSKPELLACFDLAVILGKKQNLPAILYTEDLRCET